MDNRGFTLIELTISFSILTVLTIIGFIAVSSAASAMRLADTKSFVSDDLRQTLLSMTQEIQLASKTAQRDATAATVDPLDIEEDPVQGSPFQIVFRIPLDATGNQWSDPIVFRYINEDTDGNGRLNGDEDLDGNGVLTQCFVRLTPREDGGMNQTPVGGATHIESAVASRLDDERLRIALVGARYLDARQIEPLRAQASVDIYLQN